MTVSLVIDGQKVIAKEGENLIDVARKNGAMIPSLCHHKYLKPYGACRLCLVEVTKNGRKKITTSCNYKVLDAIEVKTDTKEIRRNQKMILELLLPMAPESTVLKQLAKTIGLELSRFKSNETPSNRKDCILCGRCSRVCTEVVLANAITFTGRGYKRGLETPFGDRVANSCIGCGACSSVCPTGAIEMEHLKIEVLRKKPATNRPCRYNLMGMMNGAVCPNNYNCATCEIDQSFVEICSPVHPVFVAKGFAKPKGWEE